MMESSPAILHFYKKQRNVHTEKKKKKKTILYKSIFSFALLILKNKMKF